MLKVLVLSFVTSLSLNAVAADSAVVPFQQAPQYYNQTKTVEGTVVGTYCDAQRCFLNFDKDFRKYLSVVIEGANVGQFTHAATPQAKQADLEKSFGGKKVQVTGAITEFKGKDTSKPGRPQIGLTATANIKVVK